MIICKCDRCGKEETINTVYPYLFGDEGHKPKFFITKNEGSSVKMIHLCSDCENAFEEFIKTNCGDDGILDCCHKETADHNSRTFMFGDKVRINPGISDIYYPYLKNETFTVRGAYPGITKGTTVIKVVRDSDNAGDEFDSRCLEKVEEKTR